MARIVFKKVKIFVIALIGTLIGGGIFIYQKLFGGKIQYIPKDQQIVGQEEDNNTVTQEVAQEEDNDIIVQEVTQEYLAVAYSQTPAQGVREVIERTGNLDFIEPGQKVLIKPNVNSDDPAPATTHPEALAEVIRLVKAKGAYVIVGDRSNANWNTMDAMKRTGMYDAAKDAGADEIIAFDDLDWVRVKPQEAANWPEGFRVPELLQEVDHIISVPVLHTHSITSHSLALKNLVGLIHPSDRSVFHRSSRIQEMIAEISLAVRPSLTVIDGTKSFITGGPFRGTLREPKVYLASKDILAADVVGVELLRKDGAGLKTKTTWDSPMIKRAYELNVGFLSKEDIEEEWKRNRD